MIEIYIQSIFYIKYPLWIKSVLGYEFFFRRFWNCNSIVIPIQWNDFPINISEYLTDWKPIFKIPFYIRDMMYKKNNWNSFFKQWWKKRNSTRLIDNNIKVSLQMFFVIFWKFKVNIVYISNPNNFYSLYIIFLFCSWETTSNPADLISFLL